ncbi:MAG TPA: hypothetical protein VM328_01840, partial [Fimbriimonadaceae bacterium]|nr:hypothetical protein [Fimbriimonadaceae bacterium]
PIMRGVRQGWSILMKNRIVPGIAALSLLVTVIACGGSGTGPRPLSPTGRVVQNIQSKPLSPLRTAASS